MQLNLSTNAISYSIRDIPGFDPVGIAFSSFYNGLFVAGVFTGCFFSLREALLPCAPLLNAPLFVPDNGNGVIRFLNSTSNDLVGVAGDPLEIYDDNVECALCVSLGNVYALATSPGVPGNVYVSNGASQGIGRRSHVATY